mmetsp:Transcript_19001/g.15563  ORF Transcript_19001/g.15563 Transcript_19001/m.15563 type:complete len:85 (+) Transcript_19001:300-554(+)
MFAGTDTTKSALVSMIDHLADNKEVVEFIRKKQEENKLFVDGKLDFEKLSTQTYMDNLIYENLRIRPPVSGIMRKALVDFEIDD